MSARMHRLPLLVAVESWVMSVLSFSSPEQVVDEGLHLVPSFALPQQVQGT